MRTNTIDLFLVFFFFERWYPYILCYVSKMRVREAKKVSESYSNHEWTCMDTRARVYVVGWLVGGCSTTERCFQTILPPSSTATSVRPLHPHPW